MKKLNVLLQVGTASALVALIACGGVHRNDPNPVANSADCQMTPSEIAALPDVDSPQEQEELSKKIDALIPEGNDSLLDTTAIPEVVPAIAEQGVEAASVIQWGLHPRASLAIQAAGIPAWRITQTIGSAAASAGTHLQDGTYDGFAYSAATDFSTSGLSSTQIKNMLERLGLVGFAAWYRQSGYDGWSGVSHIHAVYTNCLMKSSLRSQVKSWLEGRNGLVSNQIYGFYKWSNVSKKTIKSKFGASGSGTSNGGNDILPGAVYLSKLHFGQTDSDSVKRLQVVLGLAPIDGYYGPMTDDAVRSEQASAGYTPDPWHQSYVGPMQAARVFPAGTGYTIYK